MTKIFGKARQWLLFMTGVGLLTACDDGFSVGPGPGSDPRALSGQYSWVLERFSDGQAVGFPTTQLTWDLPTRYRNEVFRVYSRRSTGGTYRLIATVTSCSDEVCRYTDTNIVGGSSYDYYIAALDERNGVEVGTSDAIRVDVPVRPNMTPPSSPSATALDGSVYVRWGPTGVQRYLVLVQQDGGPLTTIGETDGSGFLDGRAVNGSAYTYFVAAVDDPGHVSNLSQAQVAYPRPDYFTEIIYVNSDNSAASGFRFVNSETLDPIVSGNSPAAQWRLDVLGGALRVQPLGPTAITEGIFTTMLTCGPGSDGDCVDVTTAPPATQFGTGSVLVEAGNTHVLRVVAPDNATHFAKIRVQGPAIDGLGRRLMIFDWAYQLRPDETSLGIVKGEGVK